jgi:SAM-dependent methyltransferase
LSTAACIACGATIEPSDHHDIAGHPSATCPRCGLRWLTDPPQGEELAALYSSGFYEPGPARANGLVELGHEFNNTIRLRELRGLGHGRLLDIGSGRGRFLAAAKSAGWDVTGIEFEPGLAEMSARRFGVPVVVGDAVSADVDGPFDVVTMWHVLEHLPDPHAALERAAALLRPGGTLIVSVPNNDSLQARLGGDAWLHLDIPRHLWHFTPASLARLVSRSGLRVVRIGHFYPEMEAIGVIQTVLNRMGVEPDLLYRFAKRDRTVMLRPNVIVSLAVAATMLPVALVWTVLAPLFRSGASVQLVATMTGRQSGGRVHRHRSRS